MEKLDKKFNKISKKKFNIYAFIFGHLYMYYCRMFLYGFLALIIELFVLLISYSEFIFVIILLFHILYGFFTNKIYNYFVTKKLIDNNKPLFNIYILRILAIIYIIFFVVIDISIILNDIEYRSYIYYDSSVNINDEYEMTIPNNFQKEDSYYFNYINYSDIDDMHLSACDFSFYKVNNYNNIKKIVKQLKKENKYYNNSNLRSKTINSIKWSYFISQSEYRDIYYYITYNNGIYLFTYNISKDYEDKYVECIKDYSAVINSIKVKH